jgi:VWFA-related protein
MTSVRRAAAAVTALALSAGSLSAQAPAPAPASAEVFPAGIEQVTVDVVVVDRKGEPVTGLTRDDFTVTDEGKPQQVTTFDQVKPQTASAPSAVPLRPRVVSNLTAPADLGRLFVVVFDDIHMSPLNAQRAKSAIASFIDRGTQDGDRLLLLATGGAAWWSTRLPGGRADLLEVLKHLDGRRILDNARERMTDYEAVQIAVYRDVQVAARVSERFERYGTSSREAQARSRQENPGNGMFDPYIEQRAYEQYISLKNRMDVTLGVLERCFQSLERSRERKAVLMVSEGFAYDVRSEGRKRAIEAARRANASLYFIDTRGLEGLTSFYSAEFGAPFAETDLMAAVADVSREGDGAEALASDTGGFSVRDTNDFAAGAVRIGQESRSYYLLGYNPGEVPRDGRFRKIEVKVRRKGLVVRARRGYYAPSADGSTPAVPPEKRFTEPDLQRALDAPGAVSAIPLRLTAFVQQETTLDRARVVLAAEADVAKVPATATGEQSLSTIDTLLVIAHRESAEFVRDDQQVQLARKPAPPGVPVWYSFRREVELKPGSHQAKLIVRDPVTHALGSVILEIDVPPLGGLRVSTPVLSSGLQPAADGSLAPVVRVERAFAAGSQLYCSFDVYDAARGTDGFPRVKAGHALRRAGGAVLGSTPPNAMRPTSIGALSRLIQIPLAGRAVGDYELVVTVSDELSGETREIVEPFTIVEPSGRGGD